MGEVKPLWRPFDRAYIANPYDMYRALREQDPVHKSQTGEWIITRYDDAKEILRSNQFLVGNRFEWLKKGIDYFKDKEIDFSGIENAMKGFILFLNAPDHTRIRKFIHSAWGDRSVESIIQENLEQLIGGRKGKIDLVQDLGKPLPAMTISKILGLPPEDYKYLKELGSVMIKALDLYITFKDIQRINEAAKSFIIYFRKVIEEKKKNPGSDLISEIILRNEAEKALDSDEMLSTCILLFIAGEETSISLLSTGVYNLIRHEAAIEEIKADAKKLPGAVEELIRYDAPVQIVGRIAGDTAVIGGKEVNQGDTLTICLGSANRDPDQFERADDFVIDRDPNKHLGFGGGAHYCLGDWLARVQTRMALEFLIESNREIKLLDEVPQWNENLAIRSLKALPVQIN